MGEAGGFLVGGLGWGVGGAWDRIRGGVAA
jgi:hypothetical protein